MVQGLRRVQNSIRALLSIFILSIEKFDGNFLQNQVQFCELQWATWEKYGQFALCPLSSQSMMVAPLKFRNG